MDDERLVDTLCEDAESLTYGELFSDYTSALEAIYPELFADAEAEDE